MKRKDQLIAWASMALLGGMGCTNDLNVEPLDPTVSTASTVYSNAEGYEKALFKIYSVWALTKGFAAHSFFSIISGNTLDSSGKL